MAAIKKVEFSGFVKNFKFKELFNTLGWNNDNTSIPPIRVDDEIFLLRSISQKNGFRIFVCKSNQKGDIPLQSVRNKIECSISPISSEHIIIYTNKSMTEQVWQLVNRMIGQPPKRVEVFYNTSMDTEKLYERASGLVFTLEEEGSNTIVDVISRVRSNFAVNSEKVTKKFYDSFKKYQKQLNSFIIGIDDKQDIDWYSSLMLNRLMFCYFIQKRGFLNGDKNYLSNKLSSCKEKIGDDNFYSFYRSFLLKLFHNGLGNGERSKDLIVEIGNIPYLNGGLFEVHEIESKYPEIQISDEAFEIVFSFFDEWDWHLDTNSSKANGKEINPDVLGYIFEKYINDRAEMGAYYTQEDITEYISKNCILPCLFSKLHSNYPSSLTTDGSVWSWLKVSGDRYIYDSVKKGMDLILPSEIQHGIDTNTPQLLERRNIWNKLASEEYALPTETWREVVARRLLYSQILDRIEVGEITSIDNFITYNLDICTFTRDILINTTDYNLIVNFYNILKKITILDPTCGSGAFLFASLNILEPLYAACLCRFEEILSKGSVAIERKIFRYAEDVMCEIKDGDHPDLGYFIYKSIILNNLFGVDIMEEATETAKLRLFLKLISCVEPQPNKENMGVEPLPDIDFNIKCGNSLVGFANRKDIEAATVGTIDGMFMAGEVHRGCEMIGIEYAKYRIIQQNCSDDYGTIKTYKRNLKEEHQKLNRILDKMLFGTNRSYAFDEWQASHHPFHWYAEFYEIIALNEGFDVIIGNPPYVEYSKNKGKYKIENYNTEKCGNLYAYVVERNKSLSNPHSYSGMIIPHSAFCTDRMASLMKNLENSNKWISTYDIRPAKLFNGVDQRLAIYISCLSEGIPICFSSKYNRWKEENRENLFSSLTYCRVKDHYVKNCIIKNGSDIFDSILQKIRSDRPLGSFTGNGKNYVYYHNAPRYWIRATQIPPYFYNDRDGEKLSGHLKTLLFDEDTQVFSLAILNSSLFYLWFIAFSDSRDLNTREIYTFPFSRLPEEKIYKLKKLVALLMNDLEKNKVRKETEYKTTGKVIYDEYYPKKSKAIIDQVDEIFAEHYGFTEEELDYIVNYDIKYRMNGFDEDDSDLQ